MTQYFIDSVRAEEKEKQRYWCSLRSEVTENRTSFGRRCQRGETSFAEELSQKWISVFYNNILYWPMCPFDESLNKDSYAAKLTPTQAQGCYFTHMQRRRRLSINTITSGVRFLWVWGRLRRMAWLNKRTFALIPAIPLHADIDFYNPFRLPRDRSMNRQHALILVSSIGKPNDAEFRILGMG